MHEKVSLFTRHLTNSAVEVEGAIILSLLAQATDELVITLFDTEELSPKVESRVPNKVRVGAPFQITPVDEHVDATLWNKHIGHSCIVVPECNVSGTPLFDGNAVIQQVCPCPPKHKATPLAQRI